MGLQIIFIMLFTEVLKTARGFNIICSKKYSEKLEYLVPLTTGIADDAHIPGKEEIVFERHIYRSIRNM